MEWKNMIAKKMIVGRSEWKNTQYKRNVTMTDNALDITKAVYSFDAYIYIYTSTFHNLLPSI